MITTKAPPPTTEAQLANNIESHLAAKRISRKSIHDLAGISRPTFDRSMAGGRSFTIIEVIRIADALGVEPYELLPREFTGREAA